MIARPPQRLPRGSQGDTERDLAALPREEAERTRARLVELGRACGCTLGATAAFAGLAAYIAILAFGSGLLADSVWVSVGAGAGVFVIAATIGKTLGLIRARRQLDRLVAELHLRVANRT